MKIECKAFVDILDQLSPIVKAGSIREKTAAILLHDNQVIAQCEDAYLSIMLDHGFDNIAIPFDKVYNLLSRFNPKKKIGIFQEDEKLKVITTGIGRKKTTASIAGLTDVDILYINPFEDDRWLPIPSNFTEGLSYCKFSLPRESLNPVLTSYGIDRNVVTTSDDFRISQYWLDDTFEQTLVISAVSGDTLIANDFKQYISEDKYFDFRKDGYFARVTLSNLDYPVIEKGMFNYNDFFSIRKAAIINALERASIFAEGESDLDFVVNLKITYDTKPKFFIKAENDFGKINETGALEVSNIEKDLAVNPVYLLQVVKAMIDDTIQIGIDEHDRLIFSEGNFSHILATYKE